MLLAGEVTATASLAAQLCHVISVVLLPGKCTPDSDLTMYDHCLAEMTSQVGRAFVNGSTGVIYARKFGQNAQN